MSKKRITSSPKSLLLVDDLFQEFILDKEIHGLSKSTLASYKDSFKKIQLFIEKDTTINQLNKNFLTSFIQVLIDSDVSIATINHYLRELRAFLYWCMDNNYIYPSYKISLLKGQETIKETYSEEELLRLLQKPKANDSFVEWRDWTIVSWILATGNRAGTIINVKICDLDLNTGFIHITEQKNKKVNEIPIDSSLNFALREYIRRWRSNANPDEYLFCNVCGEQMTVNSLKLTIKKYNSKRNVSKTSIHAFRHTFAKLWVLNGGDVFKLQKILGHSTLDMTRKYVNLYGSDLKRGYDDISPLNSLNSSVNSKKRIF